MYNKPFISEGTTMYDATISAANKYGIMGGFFTYAYGWATDTGNAVFIGVLVTLVGLLVSVICQILKHKREATASRILQEAVINEDKRRKEIHEALLASLKSGSTLTPEQVHTVSSKD